MKLFSFSFSFVDLASLVTSVWVIFFAANQCFFKLNLKSYYQKYTDIIFSDDCKQRLQTIWMNTGTNIKDAALVTLSTGAVLIIPSSSRFGVFIALLVVSGIMIWTSYYLHNQAFQFACCFGIVLVIPSLEWVPFMFCLLSTCALILKYQYGFSWIPLRFNLYQQLKFLNPGTFSYKIMFVFALAVIFLLLPPPLYQEVFMLVLFCIGVSQAWDKKGPDLENFEGFCIVLMLYSAIVITLPVRMKLFILWVWAYFLSICAWKFYLKSKFPIKALTCSICFHDYTRRDAYPAQLGCGHTFCFSCTSKFRQRCPTCRTYFMHCEIRKNPILYRLTSLLHW